MESVNNNKINDNLLEMMVLLKIYLKGTVGSSLKK